MLAPGFVPWTTEAAKKAHQFLEWGCTVANPGDGPVPVGDLLPTFLLAGDKNLVCFPAIPQWTEGTPYIFSGLRGDY